MNYNIEAIGIILSLFTGFIGLGVTLWKKIIKPLHYALNDYENAKSSISKIEAELTTHSGSSLKDVISRIDARQAIIDQRIKASFNYVDHALFETDRGGRLIWANDKFYELTGDEISSVSGLDWISYIVEEERDRFLREFSSCLKTSRKLEIISRNIHDRHVKLVGYPYKVNGVQDGFLLRISVQD